MARSPTFSRLFEQHRGPVVRYLRRRLGDDAAEAAAIDVFGQAVDARTSSPNRYGSPRPWLYALATETISERWRTDRSRLERLERLAHLPPVPHPALQPPRRLDPGVAAGLRSLAAVDRETVLLIAWGELPREDVAATLGIPLETVRDRLARARSQVRDTGRARQDLMPGGELAGSLAEDLSELLAVLGDNADLGLEPVRQPRIESAINRRFAVAPSRLRPRPSAGGPQPVGA
ncbi:MAG: RNA polymerase sigma factor [Patulibacter sp.]